MSWKDSRKGIRREVQFFGGNNFLARLIRFHRIRRRGEPKNRSQKGCGYTPYYFDKGKSCSRSRARYRDPHPLFPKSDH